MHLIRHTFRLWWQKPRKIADAPEDRTVSFLELLYDLVYVWIIAQLTHAFAAHVGVSELLGFIGLFAMVWLAWVNGSFYHELHGNNDIRTRIFTFLQMFPLVGLAIFSHGALAEGASAFALSYAVYLSIITFLWWRAGVHDLDHAPLSRPYSLTFLATTIVFFISAFVATPINFYLWALGLVLTLVLPIVLLSFNRRVTPEHIEQSQRLRPSIIERFGLLTIIVIGEVINSIVQGAAEHDMITGTFLFTVGLSVAAAISIWWVYFDLAAGRNVIQKTAPRFLWIYLHLPITMSIALAGGAMLNILKYAQVFTDFDRWLIVGPIGVFLLSVVLLIRLLDIKVENRDIYQHASWVALLAATGILLLGFSSFDVLWTFVFVDVLLLAPVFFGFRLWVKRMHSAQHA